MFHRIHRISAIVLGSFITAHLLNHGVVLLGIEQHIELMERLRLVYRNPFVEVPLLVCVLIQVVTGVTFVWQRRGQRTGFFEKAQALSGLYLAFFLLNHVGAVLAGRFGFGLDTNVYFGIAGYHSGGFVLFFAPYYALAVVSIFVHISCALVWLTRKRISERMRQSLAMTTIVLGVVFAGVLTSAFMGMFFDITIPDDYFKLYTF